MGKTTRKKPSTKAVAVHSPDDYHLRVYQSRSVLVLPGGEEITFIEGKNSDATKKRYESITKKLESGFLLKQIELCKLHPEKLNFDQLTEDQKAKLDGLVDSMTSEVGRALIGLSVLQLTVKSIEPLQSIRLHKGGRSDSRFSWVDGISMRTLDSTYITPALRSEGLLKLNADGFMMTRTLAENYPYTGVYKAEMKGARFQWLDLIEWLEAGTIEPIQALHFLLSKLLNNAQNFTNLADETISTLKKHIKIHKFDKPEQTIKVIRKHMLKSNYAARIMEIAMHSLMQALYDMAALQGLRVEPLSQMRSANKKHGNIGDIELMEGSNIIESWDAKFGKAYLRDELEELNDKLELHSAIQEAGFVTSEDPQLLPEITDRISEIKDMYGINIRILTLENWVDEQISRLGEPDKSMLGAVSQGWIFAYTECLAQRRPLQAPIDEPCYQWLSSLHEILQSS